MLDYIIDCLLPCIVIALTPQFSTSLQNSIVSSTVGKQRILHVIGTEQPLTNVVKILIYRIFCEYIVS